MEIKNVKLVYFSPTGGTRKVAQLLGKQFQKPVVEIDITSFWYDTKFASDDLVVFCMPVYGGRIPAPCYERLEVIHGVNTPAVTVAVFGNRAVDDANRELSDLIGKQGFVTVAAAEFIAPHSICTEFGAGRPDAFDIKVMERFVSALETKLAANPAPKAITVPGNADYVKYNGIPLKPVSGKDCVGCGACAQVCPAKAIDCGATAKTNSSKCISCMACLDACPTDARHLPKPMLLAAKAGLKLVCSDRKEPKYYI